MKLILSSCLFFVLSLNAAVAPFRGVLVSPGAGTKRASSVVGGGGGGQTQNDDFNRADNADLGANWTPVQSTMVISGNAATYSGVGSDACERYSGVTWSANQSSAAKVTGGTTGPGEGIGVSVRCSSSANTYFRLVINGDGEWELGRKIGGTYTTIASGTTTYSAGAILKLTATGTSPNVSLVSVYNGSQIDSRTHNVGSSDLDTGSPGVTYSSNMATASVDDWEGIDGL